MKALRFSFLVLVFAILSCTNVRRENISVENSGEKPTKKYDELWGFSKNGERKFLNDYEGLWRVYRVGSDINSISNYCIYDLIYALDENKHFICSFIGYNPKPQNYRWEVSFTVLEKKEEIEGYEKFGEGITDVYTTIPRGYMKEFAPIIISEGDGILRSYFKEYYDETSFDYKVYSELFRLLPSKDINLQISKYFEKQNPDSSLDQLIYVDPIEGMWYLSADNSPASEEAFINTKAILIIGKDEELNPGWYHVVLYYDSGDKDKGWICEWGAAEIAETELYVQLSAMSEGKPFNVKLNEKNGKKWLSIQHSVPGIKNGQFVRILPLK